MSAILWKPLFARIDLSNFRDGSVHFRNSEVKESPQHNHCWPFQDGYLGTVTIRDTQKRPQSGTPDKALVAPDKPLMAPDKALVAPAKALMAPDKALVAPDKALMALDKALVAPDKALMAPDKALMAPDKALVHRIRL